MGWHGLYMCKYEAGIPCQTMSMRMPSLGSRPNQPQRRSLLVWRMLYWKRYTCWMKGLGMRLEDAKHRHHPSVLIVTEDLGDHPRATECI